LKSGSWWQQF